MKNKHGLSENELMILVFALNRDCVPLWWSEEKMCVPVRLMLPI